VPVRPARPAGFPGVGKVIACALHAFVNDIHTFKNGRQFAAWIGLTPKLAASGDNSRLGAITKRGNRTLRRLLIQGCRIILNYCEKSDTPLNCWARQLKGRMHSCQCVVALANKLARIIWYVLAHDEVFDPKKACA
jgi:transposase